MHPSREVGRFQMGNLSSRQGDCGRYIERRIRWNDVRFYCLKNL